MTPQSTPATTKIQIDFPDAPKMFERFKDEENRAAFDKWYFDFKTSLVREFEDMAKLIDEKQDKTTIAT